MPFNPFGIQMRPYLQEAQLGRSGWLLLLSSVALLYIFSLPGVMAIRSMLLLFAFMLSFKFFMKALQAKPKLLLIVFTLFILLLIWMLTISALIANHPAASIAEWKGQWLTTFLAFIIGTGLACALSLSRMRLSTTVAMIILIPVTLYMLTNAVVISYDKIRYGKLLTQQVGISMHKAIIGYLIALIEPLIVVDSVLRIIKRRPLFPFPEWGVGILLMLILFSLFTATARNGIIIMFVALLLGCVFTYREIYKTNSLRRILTFLLGTIFSVALLSIASYKIDPRWQSFIETVPVAWDIDNHNQWLNIDSSVLGLPNASNGKPVEESAYYRIAWAHEGWRLLMAHPWGTEISRSAFRDLEVEKHPSANIPYSHNSWLDFGLQVGLPGLLLWVLILLCLGWSGWKSWQMGRDPLGLSLALLVIMFSLRGLLDETFREQIIEQFALVAGLLFGSLLELKPHNTQVTL
jgi:hypothetical protein